MSDSDVTATATDSDPAPWAFSVDDRDQPAGRVFALVLERYLDEFREREPAVRADVDVEALHDYRVSLRRARSILSAGGDVYPAEELELLEALMSRLADSTSEVRDLDVLLDELDDHVEGLPELLVAGGIAPLRAAIGVRRDALHGVLLGELASEEHQTLLRRWEVMASVYRVGGTDPGPAAQRRAGKVVDEVLATSLRQVRKRARRALRSGDVADWHDLRKRVKRARYLLAAFGPLSRPDVEALHDPDQLAKGLRKLQNRLGTLQDHVARSEVLASIGRDAGGDAALLAGALVDRGLGLAEHGTDVAEAAWERFGERVHLKSLLRDLEG